jgi:hypothetical protein
MASWILSAATIRASRIVNEMQFMSDEMLPPEKPNDETHFGSKMAWLVCAFIPCLVAILCFQIQNPPPSLFRFLLFLNSVCALCSGIGLLGGLKDKVVRVILGVFLGSVFFVLNVFIVLFVGCSGMGGRIAP